MLNAYAMRCYFSSANYTHALYRPFINIKCTFFFFFSFSVPGPIYQWNKNFTFLVENTVLLCVRSICYIFCPMVFKFESEMFPLLYIVQQSNNFQPLFQGLIFANRFTKMDKKICESFWQSLYRFANIRPCALQWTFVSENFWSTCGLNSRISRLQFCDTISILCFVLANSSFSSQDNDLLLVLNFFFIYGSVAPVLLLQNWAQSSQIKMQL